MNGVFRYIETSNEPTNAYCCVPMCNSVESLAALEVEQHRSMLSHKTSSTLGGTQKHSFHYLHPIRKKETCRWASFATMVNAQRQNQSEW
mmetsp:Transcript_32181/g.69452  ORF Transcript_32181/g.69452 Transcript_32181/m.69452 type:complete len:90 (+) Transcript_32181:47-316(+)